MTRRLFDKAADIALLRRLVQGGRRWQGHDLTRDAIAWLMSPRGQHPADDMLQSKLVETLRTMRYRAIVEMRKGEFNQPEWRLAPHIDMRAIKLLTGGIDPMRMSAEECLELDQPHIQAKRRVEFEPEAYMTAVGTQAKLRKAICQCPSPWALAERIKKIDARKYTVRANQKDTQDERHPEAACA